MFLGCLLYLLLASVALVYLGLGAAGIEHHLGPWASFGALVLALVLRVVFPITVGVFFAVVDVLGWPWYVGILIAAPGLVLVVPHLVLIILGAIFNWIEGLRRG